MKRLHCDRFPRASKYNPEWSIANVGGGANPLWLTEWLSEVLDLKPGMRVLDLGCGRAVSSIFLRREFGVQVWAVDLWYDVSENLQRIRDAGVEDGVFPLRCEARALPFATEFFDAIVSIDSFFYYGTDDHYLSYIARFLRPGSALGISGAGLMEELDGVVPQHLREWWTLDMWCLHSANWWRRHWQVQEILDIDTADTLHDGWKLWLTWQEAVAPENKPEIEALQADAGRILGYVRAAGRRRAGIQLMEPILSVPTQYIRKPLQAPEA